MPSDVLSEIHSLKLVFDQEIVYDRKKMALWFLFLIVGTSFSSALLDIHRFGKYHHNIERQKLPTIAGGNNAPRGLFAYMVSIQFRDPSPSHHICGGTLIAPQWVLTAAHCIDRDRPETIQVVTGEYDLARNENTEQVLNAKEFLIHEDFTRNNRPYEHDIALIRLEKPVKLNQMTRLARMPNHCDHISADRCFVVGWGTRTNSTRNTDIQQFVQIPVLRNRVCSDIYDTPYLNHESVICAGSLVGGKGFCTRDEGGPLACTTPDGRWEVEGIASWRIGCAEKYFPGVYMSVSHYYDWIFDKIIHDVNTYYQYRCIKRKDVFSFLKNIQRNHHIAN